MSTKSESTEPQTDQINLKHRVTGAGVLILFGAIVLPWLLGPPSEATKETAEQTVQSTKQVHSTFEDQVLAELDGSPDAFDEPEETVYVSKITPVDGERVPSKPEQQVSTESKSLAPKALEVNALEPVAKNDKTETVNAGAPVLGSNDDTDNKAKQANTTSKPSNDSVPDVVSPEVPKPDPRPAVKPAPKKLEVGWVVQVELLIDKQGARRLVNELSGKGFEPHTTIVDTNRGKNTGTRIWLGPFQQRAQAAVENDKLEAKMGKRGFIRVYP